MRTYSYHTFKKHFICDSCGGPRSDRSEHYCSSCNKTRSKVNTTSHPEYSSTSDWLEDSSGVKTRFHGDLERVLESSLEKVLEKI